MTISVVCAQELVAEPAGVGVCGRAQWRRHGERAGATVAGRVCAAPAAGARAARLAAAALPVSTAFTVYV